MPRGRPLRRARRRTATRATRRTTRPRRTRTTRRPASRRSARPATAPNAWRPASFDHNATRFPLTGAHTRGRLREVPRGRALHGDAHGLQLLPPGGLRGDDEPEPPGRRLPDAVPDLPQHERLAAATVDHSTTRFPLTGAHPRVDCARCHAGGRYTGTPTDCYSCHQANYAGTTNPNHQAAGFPTQCQTCHSTSAWRPATVDHSKTRFPLTGAHTRVDCARCHVGGRYTGTPTDCYSCHQANYAGDDEPEPPGGRLPDPVPELPHHDRLEARELRPRRALLPDLLGHAPGQVDELQRVPRQLRQLQGLRVHPLPRALEQGEGGQRPQGRSGLRVRELRLLPVPPQRARRRRGGFRRLP